MKKLLFVSAALILTVSGFVARQSKTANPSASLLKENIEALSFGEELIFTKTCFLIYQEESSVFQLAFFVRKCVPCGELVRVWRADNTKEC